MTERAFRVGDTVYVMDGASWPEMVPSAKYPGEWKVEKVNPRTLGLRQGTRGLKADRALCAHQLPEGFTSTTAGTSQDMPIGQPYRIPFSQGDIVRWPQAKARTGQTLMVVITDDGGPTVTRLVPLDNQTGKFWRRVPASQLTKLSLADILAEGVEK